MKELTLHCQCSAAIDSTNLPVLNAIAHCSGAGLPMAHSGEACGRQHMIYSRLNCSFYLKNRIIVNEHLRACEPLLLTDFEV
jgi:hypothetical protein